MAVWVDRRKCRGRLLCLPGGGQVGTCRSEACLARSVDDIATVAKDDWARAGFLWNGYCVDKYGVPEAPQAAECALRVPDS
jgi:hypothetical protein